MVVVRVEQRPRAASHSTLHCRERGARPLVRVGADRCPPAFPGSRTRPGAGRGPAGPISRRARPAARARGHAHARTRACAPRARAAGRARRDRPGGPRPSSRTSAATRERRWQRSAPTRTSRRAPRSRRSTSSGRSSRSCSTRTTPFARASCWSASRASARAATYEAGLAEADVVVQGEYRTQVVLHNSMETSPGGRAVGRRHARGLYLDAVHLGRPRGDRGDARHPRRQDPRGLPLHGRRLRLEEQPGRLHLHRDRAREAHCSSGSVRTDEARGEPRDRQSQRDHPAPDDRREGRRHAHGARRRVRERHGLERLVVAGRRADAAALLVPEREDDDVRRRRSTSRR